MSKTLLSGRETLGGLAIGCAVIAALMIFQGGSQTDSRPVPAVETRTADAAEKKPYVVTKTDSIDVPAVITHLPLKERTEDRSETDKRRVRWAIKGAEVGRLESIGDRQTNADVLGWQCAMYDKAGSLIWPVPGQLCYEFSAKIFAHFLESPDVVLRFLLESSGKGKWVVAEYGAFSFETTGDSFLVRKIQQ